MPSARELVSNLKKHIRMLDPEDISESEKRDIEDQIRFIASVANWSPEEWENQRSLFLCERGPDLDTGMLLRAKTDARAVDAISEKARKQIEALALLAEHAPKTCHLATEALLECAKFATSVLNNLALERNVASVRTVAWHSDVWPILGSPHRGLHQKTVTAMRTLDVGSKHPTNIGSEARSKRTDAAGQIAQTLLRRIEDFIAQYGRMRTKQWFWRKLPGWARKLIDLPAFDKEGAPAWASIAVEMLKLTFTKSSIVRSQKSLCKLLNARRGKRFSFPLACQTIRSRIVGLAPKTALQSQNPP